MGTYAYCLGEMDIPEEDRAEYARQVLEILRAGGMMTVEELPLYRRKIYLLSPPELDEEGRAKGCYNYFEKTSWENWGLSAKRGDSQGRFSFGREPPLRDPKRNTRSKPLDPRTADGKEACAGGVRVFFGFRLGVLLFPLSRCCGAVSHLMRLNA